MRCVLIYRRRSYTQAVDACCGALNFCLRADSITHTHAHTPPPPHTHSALCLEFTLQPSTYATMLLRELLKRSMTTDEMKKMNPAPVPAPVATGKGEAEEGAEEEEG